MSNTDDFIVEIGTEELPPLSLEILAKAFHDNLTELLKESSLEFDSSQYYATPRRLAVAITALSKQQDDKSVEKLGPAISAAYDDTGNPKPAAIGFAKSCGVSINELSQTKTDKGLRLSYTTTIKGKQSNNILGEFITTALSKLPIPKAMRWGQNKHSFIRPVKWLLVMQGNEIIPCSIYNCISSNKTTGHRFMSSGTICLEHANQYLSQLKTHYVIANINERKQIITEQVNQLAANNNAIAIIDPDLLLEVSALVEWPVALMGNFEESFLKVPQEALITTMAKNQKYFHLENKSGQLLPNFITISNIKSHNPTSIIKGNERVIRPRLADAEFFFNLDCKHSLLSLAPKLSTVLFQSELGSVLDKTKRIEILAKAIAGFLAIPTASIEKASKICKSDLLTNMVKEFPSLQGIMGRYYAFNDGESVEVSTAMDEIYLPRFAGDKLPSTHTGICLALADRLDTLVGIFSIGQVPTGNKDPFALRRASLGVLRIIIEKHLDLNLKTLLSITADNYTDLIINDDRLLKIMGFFNARLKAMFLDKGFSSEVIASVLSLGISAPLDIQKRIIAVNSFKELDVAPSLAELNKRVANILAKNSADVNIAEINSSLLNTISEQNLVVDIAALEPKIAHLCSDKNYEEALSVVVTLKPSIDNFFESVMVIDENIDLRINRLAILKKLRALFLSIADISQLQL